MFPVQSVYLTVAERLFHDSGPFVVERLVAVDISELPVCFLNCKKNAALLPFECKCVLMFVN